MLEDTLLSSYRSTKTSRGKPVSGRLEIRFNSDGQHTYVDHLYQKQPLRVLFPRDSNIDNLTVLVNMAGGVVGGDQHCINIECGPNAVATVTGQAAEKIYRSTGAIAQIEQFISVARQGWLEMLPQGTILFNGCRVKRKNHVTVLAGGRCMIGEILTFGRIAMGETLRNGLVRDEWKIFRDKKLCWADFFHIDDEMHNTFDQIAGLDNSDAMGICLYCADDASNYLDDARSLLGKQNNIRSDTLTGVSAMENLLIMRWLSKDPAHLRSNFGIFWSEFRALVGAQKSALPSIWQI